MQNLGPDADLGESLSLIDYFIAFSFGWTVYCFVSAFIGTLSGGAL